MNKNISIALNVVTLVAVLAFGISIIYAIESIDSKKEGLYQVQFNGQRHWTRNVIMMDDGMVQFVDEESKRNYKVKSEYIIVEPKLK